jgi:hypothetical protein
MDLSSAAPPDLSQSVPATAPLPPSSLAPTGQAKVWEKAPRQKLPDTRFERGTRAFKAYEHCLSEEASHVGKPEVALIRLTGWLIYRAPSEEAEENLVKMVLDEVEQPTKDPVLAVGRHWRDFFLRIYAPFSPHLVGACLRYLLHQSVQTRAAPRFHPSSRRPLLKIQQASWSTGRKQNSAINAHSNWYAICQLSLCDHLNY